MLLIKFGEASEEKDDAFLLYQTFFSDSTSELQKCSVLNLKFITKLYVFTPLSKNKEALEFLCDEGLYILSTFIILPMRKARATDACD